MPTRYQSAHKKARPAGLGGWCGSGYSQTAGKHHHSGTGSLAASNPVFSRHDSHSSELLLMPSEPIELPPQVAKAFVRDKRAFFKAKDQLKQDEIAARQLHALHAFQRPREKKLRLADVKQMFLQMRDTIPKQQGAQEK